MPSAEELRAQIETLRKVERVRVGRTADRLNQPLGGARSANQLATAARAGGPGAIHSLQRLAGNAVVVQLLTYEDEGTDDAAQRSPVLDVVGKGGGTPLDAKTRQTMEAGFGHDFSGVRVHGGPTATSSARSVGAAAYTVGNDIVMPGGLSPSSSRAVHTLAHELTHVVQQRKGPVDGTPAPGGIRVSDPSDRFEREAEQTADRLTAGQASGEVKAAPGGVRGQGPVGSGPVVQRKLPTYKELLELRKQLTGDGTVSGLQVEKQARREVGQMNRAARSGYRSGRQGVSVNVAGESGGLGMLLKNVGKSTVKNPGKMAARSHRSAAFFGAMGAGMVGRAATWAPEKLGWTGPKAGQGAVGFGEDSGEEHEEEQVHQPSVEEVDEMIRAHQRRAATGHDSSEQDSDEDEDEGSAIHF